MRLLRLDVLDDEFFRDKELGAQRATKSLLVVFHDARLNPLVELALDLRRAELLHLGIALRDASLHVRVDRREQTNGVRILRNRGDRGVLRLWIALRERRGRLFEKRHRLHFGDTSVVIHAVHANQVAQSLVQLLRRASLVSERLERGDVVLGGFGVHPRVFVAVQQRIVVDALFRVQGGDESTSLLIVGSEASGVPRFDGHHRAPLFLLVFTLVFAFAHVGVFSFRVTFVVNP
mmetsp:Transcript_6784/g.27240  ORF Transcript_6784/g.27240 Transcript_6784/m.27240 type:complete len:234 (+) Transcript_6784:1877-2578(+)